MLFRISFLFKNALVMKHLHQSYLSVILSVILMQITGSAFADLSGTLGHPPRIMALGDSITAGCCNPRVGYYQFLSDNLTTAGYQFDMVGSVYVDGYHIEAHPGAWPYDLLNGILDPNTGLRSGGIDEWIAQSAPDIVLLHAGTNGVGSNGSLNYDPQTAQWGKHVEDMRQILDVIFNANPAAFVILAKIINTRTYEPDISEYNRQLALMVSAYGNSHLHVVDMEDILSDDPLINYIDSVHPSPTGLEIMADNWYPVLTPILDLSHAVAEDEFPWEIFLPAILGGSKHKRSEPHALPIRAE